MTLQLRQWWPDIKYYVGFVTTVLVSAAWLINLKAKPLATAFGGGFTVLGVGIAIIQYRYQQREGRLPVFTTALRYLPESLLVVLTSLSEHNEQVIEAAARSADGRPLVYLYLGQPVHRDVQQLEFNDPYLFDQKARGIFSIAALAAKRLHAPAQFVYRLTSPGAVLDAWRVVRPKEIIVDAATAKTISTGLAPGYVRFQTVDGVRIAHYVERYVSGLDDPIVPETRRVSGMPSSESMQQQDGGDHGANGADGRPLSGRGAVLARWRELRNGKHLSR